jgi:hypothetical protein
MNQVDDAQALYCAFDKPRQMRPLRWVEKFSQQGFYLAPRARLLHHELEDRCRRGVQHVARPCAGLKHHRLVVEENDADAANRSEAALL